METDLEWYLASRALSGAAVTELITAEKDLSRGTLEELPVLNAVWTDSQALDFARRNIGNEIMIAQSSGVSANVLHSIYETCTLLAREQLCENPRIATHTASALYLWAKETGRQHSLDALARNVHPGKWWDTALAHAEGNVNELFKDVAPNISRYYALSITRGELAWFADELRFLLAPEISDEDITWLLASIGIALGNRDTNFYRDANDGATNAFLSGIRNGEMRVSVVSRVLCETSAVLDDSLMLEMVSYPQFVDRSRFPTRAHKLHPDVVDKALAADDQCMNWLVVNSAAHCQSWTDEQLNAVAVREPALFVRAGLTPEWVQRLSSETFNALMFSHKPDSWDDVKLREVLGDALIRLSPSVALQVALRSPATVLGEVLKSGKVPSFTAEEFFHEMSLPALRQEGKDANIIAGERFVVLNREYFPSAVGSFDNDRVRKKVVSALVKAFEVTKTSTDLAKEKVDGTLNYAKGGKNIDQGSLWLMDFLNYFPRMVIEEARSECARDDSSRVFSEAVFYRLNKHSGDSPESWKLALMLSDNWQGTLESLVLAAKDTVQVNA